MSSEETTGMKEIAFTVLGHTNFSYSYHGSLDSYVISDPDSGKIILAVARERVLDIEKDIRARRYHFEL
ncbi:hypothetical protein [Brochothrix phage BtpYZU04]